MFYLIDEGFSHGVFESFVDILESFVDIL